jgi:23S rRNA pseudouridine1911/1915/1917 synthase
MPDKVITLVCQNSGERLDKFLAASLPELSRSQAQHLIQSGRVQAAGRRLKANTRLPAGTSLTIILPPSESSPLEAQAIPLDIIFEDEHLIAINKPAGLVVHPGAGRTQNTLVNALINRYPEIIELDPKRPGIVHRLDKGTSGVIIVARSTLALQNLQKQFKARQVEKIYHALVHGHPQAPVGLIDVPIGRHPQHRQKMAPLPDGKPARTSYKVLETFTNFSLLELRPETGRMHQIRVHLAWLGHPVAGDTIYGRRKKNHLFSRPFLHASQLSLHHPLTNHPLTFAALLPHDLQTILENLS